MLFMQKIHNQTVLKSAYLFLNAWLLHKRLEYVFFVCTWGVKWFKGDRYCTWRGAFSRHHTCIFLSLRWRSNFETKHEFRSRATAWKKYWLTRKYKCCTKVKVKLAALEPRRIKSLAVWLGLGRSTCVSCNLSNTRTTVCRCIKVISIFPSFHFVALPEKIIMENVRKAALWNQISSKKNYVLVVLGAIWSNYQKFLGKFEK